MLFLGLFVFQQQTLAFPSSMVSLSAVSLSTVVPLFELLKMDASLILLLLAFSSLSSLHVVHGQLTIVGFYSSTCPQVESIVRSTVEGHLSSNPAMAPGLLRMFFHDCFVHGCDASILIAGPSSERTARQNSNLRGFEVIDDAKTQLEALCPGVVSCADILAIAARDVVFLSKGPSWEVPTGRRDGRVSLASDAADLPGARDSVAEQVRKFTEKNLNTLDLVALVGGHSIGTAACNQFRYRLFNFSTTTANGADPTIDPAFLPELQALCPQNGDGSRRVDMDTDSGGRLDESFFVNLMNRRGVLESDQRLWEDRSTQALVRSFLGGRGSLGLNFKREFSKSMVKMSNIGVKSGTEGEIRTVCSAVN